MRAQGLHTRQPVGSSSRLTAQMIRSVARQTSPCRLWSRSRSRNPASRPPGKYKRQRKISRIQAKGRAAVLAGVAARTLGPLGKITSNAPVHAAPGVASGGLGLGMRIGRNASLAVGTELARHVAPGLDLDRAPGVGVPGLGVKRMGSTAARGWITSGRLGGSGHRTGGMLVPVVAETAALGRGNHFPGALRGPAPGVEVRLVVASVVALDPVGTGGHHRIHRLTE